MPGWRIMQARLRLECCNVSESKTVCGPIAAPQQAPIGIIACRFIATSTLMSDWRHCPGARTVFEARSEAEAKTLAMADPWRTIFPVRLFRLELTIFCGCI